MLLPSNSFVPHALSGQIDPVTLTHHGCCTDRRHCLFVRASLRKSRLLPAVMGAFAAA